MLGLFVHVVSAVTFYHCFDVFVTVVFTQSPFQHGCLLLVFVTVFVHVVSLSKMFFLNVFIAFAIPTFMMKTFGKRKENVTTTIDI